MRVIRWSFFVVMCVCFQSIAFAETKAEAFLTSKKAPDIRVIIDISGSMKLNDPQNLRRPALELLVKLFPEGAKAGVWTFGQWVNMLVKHGDVNQNWREMATTAAQEINSVALYTNIPEALDKAAMDLDKRDPNYATHMILLTDGMVDISKSAAENSAARDRIINEILPRLRKAGVTIHTVALSKNADSELMERLAVDTNGLTAVAETAEELMAVFLQAFDAAAPAEQLPLEGNSFVVDSSIEEFTALIFRKPGSPSATLVSPDQKRSTAKTHDSDVNWYETDNYDLITVKSPFEGEWSLVADLEPNSRVTIVSNLSLVVSRLAASMFVGGDNELSVLLQEQGKTIQDKNILSLIDLSVAVTRRDDGQQWALPLSDKGVPSNGLYTEHLKMLAKAGIYDISVRADGKSFQREQKQSIAVREAFDIKATTSDDNPPNHTVTIFAQNPEIDTQGSNVLARVKRPDGSSALKAVTVVAERTWAIDLQGVKQTGVYTVNFEATGRYKSGESFDFTSDSVTINHNVIGSEPLPVPEVEPDPAPEPVAEVAPIQAAAPEVPAVDKVVETEEEEGGWKSMLLYGGIALGNIITIFLGYMAYKMVMGTGKSTVLEDSDDVEVTDETVAVATEQDESVADAKPAESKKTSPKPDPIVSDLGLDDDLSSDFDAHDLDDLADVDDMLDLPDDAIDIDPDK